MRRHPGDAAGKNLAALSHEFFQEIGIFVIDRFDRDVDPTSWHGAIGAAKSGTPFGGLGLHRQLFGFAMKRVLPQKRIVFLFLEPVRRARTFLVSKRHVTRDWFAERFRFGALENDNFLCHRRYSLDSAAGAASSSSPSPPSSSVKPNSEVTDCRTREALFCFTETLRPGFGLPAFLAEIFFFFCLAIIQKAPQQSGAEKTEA